MAVKLTKDSFDLGIVVADIEASLAFYRDFLGLPFQRKMPMSKTTTLHFLGAGTGAIKLWEVTEPPAPVAKGWPLESAPGFRYITLSISNIDEVVGDATAAGIEVRVPVTELMPSVKIAILADPDGNSVELLQAG
jgi:catechol 2,3-dioxygenase-like lactoylglutathione lyase family enzyme